MAKTTKNSYIGVRLDLELLQRLNRVAKGSHGLQVPLSEVVRLALSKGLDVIEKENEKVKKT